MLSFRIDYRTVKDTAMSHAPSPIIGSQDVMPAIELTERLEALPMLPSIVSRLLMIDPNSDDYFDTLLELGEQDPPFALKILNMANSAASHPARDITRLSQAIVRIGSRTISGMISAMAVMRVFMPTTEGQRYLWVHAIETAMSCRTIAHLQPAMRHLAEEAYLAGLLHDIGHFIMFDKSPNELGQLEASHWRTPAELVAAEKKICGYTHAELGGLVCEHWGLAELLSQAVRLHHDYGLDAPERRFIDGDTRRIIRLVQCSDLLSAVILRDPQLPTRTDDDLIDEIGRVCLRPGIHELGLTAEAIAGLIEGIQRDSGRLIEGLGIFPPGTDIHAVF